MNIEKEELKNLIEVEDAAMSCVQCGQCRVPQWPSKGIFYVCPVYKTKFTPNFEPFYSRGKNVILKGILWGDIPLSKEISEIFYQCTLCGACEDFCHNAHNENIDFANHRWMKQVDTYEALRADLVEAGYALESHNSMNNALIELLNPYGQDNKNKLKWIEKLNFKIKDANEEEVDVLYFVGCTAALTPQLHKIAIKTSEILNKLGVSFGIFGENEICCGSVALRTGARKIFNEIAAKNVELFNKRGIKKIVTSCAGCYRTLKKDYENLLKDVEVLHIVEFLEKYINENDIKLKKLDYNITYHDPCHLGRHMNLYDAPRNILNKISNVKEMKTNKWGAQCCGAGGGVKKGFPDLALEMAKNRIKEAEETNANILVSTCPFCFRNLSDAIIAMDSNIKMMDLVELFLESLQINLT
ncbi:MAG: (Fe-S)-binding protein [Promethearchaeota archaeon]